MHYEGITWRPPFEAESLLLQVTTGCSHNKCVFCSMYSDVPYRVSPVEEIDADIREAKANFRGKNRRAFLENGDAFSLSADRLKAVAEKINAAFPDFEYISAYASVKNIKDKSLRDLKELRSLKINKINIGVESALDDVLAFLGKGYTAEEAFVQLEKLGEAGMEFGLNFMLGAEGGGNFRRSAAANAEMINRVSPYMVFVGTLHAEEGCALYDEIARGRFRENTLRQLLDEEKQLLSGISAETAFFGTHPSNAVPLFGALPSDVGVMLDKISAFEDSAPASVLDSVPGKGEEGAIIL